MDLDAFFASVEVLKDPSLKGLPVVVGDPGPRGVVASASYEARAFGVRSAMPSSRARRLCPRLIFLPGCYSDYTAYSKKTGKILECYSPKVEAASIDEFYLDLAGCRRLHGNFFSLAENIRLLIQRELGIPASIGIGANRTLSKIASKVAKPRGVLEVLEDQEELFMAPLPVVLIPGVGPALAASLSSMGIKTAGDLASIPPPLAGRLFGACGLELHLKARGLWIGNPGGRARSPGSIGHETTFSRDTIDPHFLEATLFRLTEKSAFRLREKGLEAGRLTVKVRYSDFRTRSRTRTMEMTRLEKDIFRSALPMLQFLTRKRLRIRLVGISLSGLRPSGYQEVLFGKDRGARMSKACVCLDSLRKRFGFETVRWAAGITADFSR